MWNTICFGMQIIGWVTFVAFVFVAVGIIAYSFGRTGARHMAEAFLDQDDRYQ